MQMSLRTYGNLEITGSIMEVPRAKEPTVPRPIEKKSILPLDLSKKRSSMLLSKSLAPPTRSVSQLSQSNKKPNPSIDNKNQDVNRPFIFF
jgi:hypothetical protein